MFPINHGEVAYWFTQETFCFGSCDIMIEIHGQSGLDLFPRSYKDNQWFLIYIRWKWIPYKGTRSLRVCK